MSPRTKRFYEFGDFRLDRTEKTLSRAGDPVAITPKVFETLLALLEAAGRTIEKDELMRRIWENRFVEESNLTFNIKMLRRALGDSAHAPRFVETVPRRGYRFIAEVKETDFETDVAPAAISAPLAKKIVAGNEKSSKIYALTVASAVLLVSAVVCGIWFGQDKAWATAPILAAPFASEKLSTDGNVPHAVISPDGKIVIYVKISSGGGRQSVWLRRLDSSSNVEIIPPSDDFYYGLKIAPDNEFLYFTRRPKINEGQADLYRVSIFGGVPIKIAAATQGWTGVSFDGKQISFVRCYYREDENCALWIADSDGRNERKLAARPRPFRIGDNEFSPDGRSVVFAAGQSTTGANEFGLIQVDIENGVERELGAQKFFNIKNLEWLPDQSGLLVTASQAPRSTFRIWHVPTASDAAATPLTKDAEKYSALSLNRNADVLISTQVKEDFRLRLYQTANSAAEPRVLSSASTIAFAPNGKIVFSSVMTGNGEIWNINPDGSEQRQLTDDAANDLRATVSPSGNSIFFASNRTGKMRIWRMNADGSDQTPLASDEGGFPLLVSPDEKWLYYHSALHKTLRRVSTAGGASETVMDESRDCYAVSPDALFAAFAEKQNGKTVLIVASLVTGQRIRTFESAAENFKLNQLAWSPNGNSLFLYFSRWRT